MLRTPVGGAFFFWHGQARGLLEFGGVLAQSRGVMLEFGAVLAQSRGVLLEFDAVLAQSQRVMAQSSAVMLVLLLSTYELPTSLPSHLRLKL